MFKLRSQVYVYSVGDPQSLPADVFFDSSDDDIVIATALSSG
jgi:hypothetical protein